MHRKALLHSRGLHAAVIALVRTADGRTALRDANDQAPNATISRSLGVVSDKIASAKRNPVQTRNTTTTPTTTTATITTNNNNKGR